MKHTIIIFLLVLCLLAGCGRKPAEAEPVSDTQAVSEAAIITELPEAETNASVPDETQMDLPATEIVLEIDYASDDYYKHPENFEMYHFEGLEYGSDAVIVPNTEIYDFQFFVLDNTSLLMNGEYVITETLHTCDVISPDKPFGTRIYYAGPGSPYYGISFLDETGNQYQYVIYEGYEIREGWETLKFYLKPF